MKLIGSLASPFVRKVRIVLAEKKIDYDFEIDPPWGPDTQVPSFNPLGKVPVLLLDDETPLFDSRVIVEYIDNVTPNNKLLPTANRERTEVKRWEALADGICDAAVAAVLEGRRAKRAQSAEWIERQQEKVTRGLAFMAKELADKNYVMGTHFSLADIAAGVSLGYLEFRFPEVPWKSEYPNLNKLYGKLCQRPSFTDTLPRDA